MTARDYLALGVLVVTFSVAAGLCCSLAIEGYRGARKWMEAK